MHLCFSNKNHSVGRKTTQALVTRKYDYNIQNCHLICFSIQSVLLHPEILHPSNEQMRSICIYCSCTDCIIYLLWLCRALREAMKSLNTRALTTNMNSNLSQFPPYGHMVSLSSGTQISACHVLYKPW